MKHIRCLTVLAGLLALNGLGQTNLPTFSRPAASATWIAAVRSELHAARGNAVLTLDTPVCVEPDPRLVGWWAGEDSALDSIGGNNGSLVGGASYDAGQVNQAFVLDGVDGAVMVPDGPRLNVGAGQDFSIEAWIQPQESDTYYGVMDIVDKRQALSWTQDVGYELCVVYGRLAFRMSDAYNNSQGFGPVGVDLRDGNFHHVAVTVVRNSSTGGTFYVDGQAVGTFNPTTETGSLANSAPFRMGRSADDDFFANFKGAIDEVSLYYTALSADQIEALYDAGVAGKCTPAPAQNATRDLLLVYNTGGQSAEVKDYYLQHRPMVGGANVLPITCPTTYTITPSDYTTYVEAPLLSWLDAHPTLRPQYIVLFLDVPSRINGNTNGPPDYQYAAPDGNSSVSYRIHTMRSVYGYQPYVTHINMRDNACCGRSSTTMACKAYIDKLESFGMNYSPGRLIISPRAGGYANTNYYFDDTRYWYGSPGLSEANTARLGVMAANPAASVFYVNNPDTGYGQYNVDTGNGGWVGMQIWVWANNPLTVTKLGRMMAPENNGTHTVKLVDCWTGVDVSGGAVDISMSGGTVGQFQYGSLSPAVTLDAAPYAFRPYYLLSQETPGGDSWYDWNTQVTTTGVAKENGFVWGTGVSIWNIVAIENQTFGPVNFKYGASETPYVTGVASGVLRNDYGSLRDHFAGGSGVAGYLCWGAHSSLNNQYAIHGGVPWSGNSGWWIMQTIESFNGQPFAGQGDFYMWFDYRAFRAKGLGGEYEGAEYENTPVGAITHTDEPGGAGGWSNPFAYFKSWEEGKDFATCAWNAQAQTTTNFQAVGDPFVAK